MSLGDSVTWADWVRLVASDYGVHGLSGEDVAVLLCERTAWPMTSDMALLHPQLVTALVGPEPCPCCGGPLGTDGCAGVCAPCAARHGWA